MGETGIGKTFLIELLAMLINVEFQVLNVHAGITRLEIIDFVNICKTKCKNDDQVILFFDEINTNSNINGILKEILIDRNLQGRALPSNFIPVGACNPYRFKESEEV